MYICSDNSYLRPNCLQMLINSLLKPYNFFKTTELSIE